MIKISNLKFLLVLIALTLVFAPNVEAKKVKLKFKKENFTNIKDFRKVKKLARKGSRYIKYETPGDYIKAVDFFEKAYELAPNNVALNYYLGTAYLQSASKKKSLKHLEMVFQTEPTIATDIHFKLGRAYHLNYEFEKGRNHYLKYRATLDNKALLYWTPIIQKFVQETEYGEKYVKEPQRVFIDNLGSTANSAFPEYSPVITVDGKTLFFTSKRPDAKKRKTKIYKPLQQYYENIYRITRNKGEWSAPEKLPKPVNSKENNAVVGIDQSGQELIVFNGKDKNGDLLQTKMKSKTKWTKPKSNLFGRINSKYRETSASVHFDGKTMYFTNDNPKDSRGGSDVFESRRISSNKSWGKPKNLGSLVNSAYNEEAVFISPDGQTLYFSSNGHSSMGGYDIFKCEVQRDGTWGIPQNLGHPINTPDDDMFFSLTANMRFGYYASLGQDDTNGDWDIYKITFLGPEKPLIQSSEDMLIASLANPITEVVIEKTVEIKTIRLTIVKGIISDSFTERPVAATIEVVDNEKDEVIQTSNTNSETGEYMITLPSGRNYGIMIKATDYLHHSENFNIPEATNYQEISKNIMLNKLEAGSKVVLNNIFFEFGKSILHPSSYPELERVVAMMLAYKTLVIEISGHTDNVGSASGNITVSNSRAKAVVDYLINRGVPYARLQHKGYGFAEPIAPNDTEEGRQQNRRVEFKILKK
ncbi:MAG: OmpA family protein [Salinivirgaceae bacterium]|nr:OmpA family protein [Salinivirgaceae bacterium]